MSWSILTNYLSAFMGWLASIRLPAFLGQPILRFLVSKLGIDLTEAEHPLNHYHCFAELFRRNLKASLRPLGMGLVSPVDGTLRYFEQIDGGELLQVKGISYSLSEFVGNTLLASKFTNGSALNLYLSPRDYHHIHAPLDCTVLRVRHIPGALFPVNDWSLNRVSNLFVRNERVVLELETGLGAVCLVLVGATNVGSMKLSFCELETNTKLMPWQKRLPSEVSLSQPVQLQRGDLLGSFLLGSSVVVLFEAGVTDLEKVVVFCGSQVRMGESILGC